VSAALLLILVVATAYLATHIAYEWLAKRLLIVSGAEYLVLGILLGPVGTGLFPADAAETFRPLIIFGTGWIGLTVGIKFKLTEMVRIPAVRFRTALVQALITFATVAAGVTYALEAAFALERAVALIPGIALGAIGVASTSAGLEVSVDARRSRAPLVRQIEVAFGMDGFIAVLASGLLLAFVHDVPPGLTRPLTTTEWAVVSIGIGVASGAMYHLFLGDERNTDRVFISLAGAAILACGTAAYLELSPVFAGVVMGVTIANSSRSTKAIESVLAAAERPLYLTLLILAGALWQPSGTFTLILVIIFYFILRLLGKLYGTGLATWWNGGNNVVGLDWGRALIGQGRLTLVLALDYARRPELPAGDAVFTCALLSVLFTELFAARFLRSVIGPVLAPLKTLTVTVDSARTTMTALPVIRDIVGDDDTRRPESPTPPRSIPPAQAIASRKGGDGDGSASGGSAGQSGGAGTSAGTTGGDAS
jgi:uncharacterized membrane protein YgcG